jgi:hypothetical protein
MAKKSKGFAELLKQQQQKEKIDQQALEQLGQQVQQGPWGEQFPQMVMNPKGEAKMSEVLGQFVEPYLDEARTQHQRETLFSLAVIAWNLALMPDSDHQSFMDEVIKQGLVKQGSLVQHDLEHLLDELVTRKRTFFADNQRYIIDFHLQDRRGTFHLSVASTLMKQPTSES